MRMRRRLRAVSAVGLAGLLGVLSSGLPSHSHPDAFAPGTAAHPLAESDHHSHGTLLVEPDVRILTTPPAVPATVVKIVAWVPVVTTATVSIDPAPLLPARERAPPSDAPRAPPHLA